MPVARLLFLVLAVMMAGASRPAAETPSAPSVSVSATDPGLTARLGVYDPFYVRLAYRSMRPLILRAEGLVGGKPLPGMTNGQHPVPAGSGETMAWIAYPAGTAIDGIRIHILDDRSRPIGFFDTSARLQWDAGPRRERGQRADWAMRMSDSEQRSWSEAAAASSMGEDWLGLGFMAGVPLYFVLQVWLPVAWRGRWRIAALLPLLALAPATVFSLFALTQGSNLWPITVVLLAPLGLIYLLLLCGVRAVAKRGFA
jgi:hypothetical protein